MTPSTCRPCGSLPPRALHQPQPSDAAALGRGRDVFAANASCHGGAKWTKSQIFHRDNPAATMQNGPTLDPGVTRLAAPPVAAVPANEFFSFTCNALTINYLEDVGTFDDSDPLEIRDNAAASLAFGRNGFNVPSLAQYQLSRAVPASRPSPDPRGGLPAARVGTAGSGFPPTTTIATELTAPSRRISWYS